MHVTLLALFSGLASGVFLQSTLSHLGTEQVRKDGVFQGHKQKDNARLRRPRQANASTPGLLVLAGRGTNISAVTEMLSLVGGISVETDAADKSFYDELREDLQTTSLVVRRALLAAFQKDVQYSDDITPTVLLDPAHVPNISSILRAIVSQAPKLRVLAFTRSNPVLHALEQDAGLMNRTSGGRELLRETFVSMCNGHFVKYLASLAEGSYGSRSLNLPQEEVMRDKFAAASKVAAFLHKDLPQKPPLPQDVSLLRSAADVQFNEVLSNASKEYLEPTSPCLAELVTKERTEVVEECPPFSMPLAESTFVPKVGVDVVEQAPGVNFVAQHANQTVASVLVLGVESAGLQWFRSLLTMLPGVHVVQQRLKEGKSSAQVKRSLVKELLSPTESGADPEKVSNVVLFLDPLQLQDRSFILSGISREVPDLRVILFQRTDSAMQAAAHLQADEGTPERLPHKFARELRAAMEDGAMVEYWASFLRPYRITFEDLNADTGATMQRVANFLLGRGVWDAAGNSFPACDESEPLPEVVANLSRAALANNKIVGRMSNSSLLAMAQAAGLSPLNKTV